MPHAPGLPVAPVLRVQARHPFLDLSMCRVVGVERLHQLLRRLRGPVGEAEIDQRQPYRQCVWMVGMRCLQHGAAFADAAMAGQQFGQAQRRHERLCEPASDMPQLGSRAADPSRPLLDPSHEKMGVEMVRHALDQGPRHGQGPAKAALTGERSDHQRGCSDILRSDRQRLFQPVARTDQVRLGQCHAPELAKGLARAWMDLGEVAENRFGLSQACCVLQESADRHPRAEVTRIEVQYPFPLAMRALEVTLLLGSPSERFWPARLIGLDSSQLVEDGGRRGEPMLRHVSLGQLLEWSRTAGHGQDAVITSHGFREALPLDRDPRCLQRQLPIPGRRDRASATSASASVSRS